MSPFNLIIAGGRDFTDYDLLKTTVDEYRISRNNIRIISGAANGADALAIVYAREHNIPFDRCPADWSTHGKKAGMIRNITMGNIAHGLIAFWDGRSRGTSHMIEYMQALNKPTVVVRYNQGRDEPILQLDVF